MMKAAAYQPYCILCWQDLNVVAIPCRTAWHDYLKITLIPGAGFVSAMISALPQNCHHRNGCNLETLDGVS